MNAKHNTPETIATMLDDADIIDFNSPIPFYYQLQQCLEAKISAGEWAAGQKLPSE